MQIWGSKKTLFSWTYSRVDHVRPSRGFLVCLAHSLTNYYFQTNTQNIFASESQTKYGFKCKINLLASLWGHQYRRQFCKIIRLFRPIGSLDWDNVTYLFARFILCRSVFSVLYANLQVNIRFGGTGSQTSLNFRLQKCCQVWWLIFRSTNTMRIELRF